MIAACTWINRCDSCRSND